MNTKHVRITPGVELQDRLFELFGNRKVLYVMCEMNRMDELKIKGQIKEAATKRCKPIFCDTNGKQYESIKQASIELILDPGAISRVLSGKQSTTKGYTFSHKI